MVAPARFAAYRALTAITTDRADLGSALSTSRDGLADERDRTLAAEITIGTLRWRGRLDWVIETVAERPLDRIDASVLDVLRLSVYQLLFLDRVPVSAVVNDAVDLSRSIGRRHAAGFVNGVLRHVSRRRGDLSGPPAPQAADGPGTPPYLRAALEYLTITLSHPRWLAARWLERFGFDGAAAWEHFDNAPAPLTIHVNTLKIAPQSLQAQLAVCGVGTRRAQYAPNALIVESGNPLRTPLASTGLFQVQDEASQLVAALTGVRPGERVLDACAAPGGKSIVMAGMMQDQGLIVANDARPRRIALLARSIAASGAASIRITHADLTSPPPFRTGFDCILIDAPCSGLGTLRRDPDIRWRRSEPDLGRFADTQRSLLRHVAPLVAHGGRIVYSTCSSEPEENDDVVESFLESASGFELARSDVQHQRLAPGVAAVLDEQGCLRTSPTKHGLEAFFGAVLRRRP